MKKNQWKLLRLSALEERGFPKIQRSKQCAAKRKVFRRNPIGIRIQNNPLVRSELWIRDRLER